jgi:hypothetical protein
MLSALTSAAGTAAAGTAAAGTAAAGTAAAGTAAESQRLPRTGSIPPDRLIPPAAAAVGVAGFLLAGLPVSDLQAADARAWAAGHGVGLGYWFSWFGGAIPGRYSITSAWLSDLAGARVAGSLAVLGIALVAPVLLAADRRRLSGSLVIVCSALLSLFSGRIAFCLGALPALLGVLALRRGRVWPAAGLTVLAALASPLAAAFAVLGAAGWVFRRGPSRWPVLRYAAVSLSAILLLSAVFGTPGPTPFDRTTLLRVLAALLVPQLLRLDPPVRAGLALATAVCLGCYFLPLGVGGNISRYALFVVPPLVWVAARSGRRAVALALVPAVGYAAALFAVDLSAAAAASAQSSYYAPIAAALARQPGLPGYRVEVLDTPTHRASAQLARVASLARGWDLQADAGANPLFYGGAPLNAASYRAWLDRMAVGWVAVPDALNAHNRAEAALVATGLPYLDVRWRGPHWTLFAVRNATPIVSQPARLLSASPGQLWLWIPRAMTVLVRVRPSPFLRVSGDGAASAAPSLRPAGPLQVAVTVAGPGRYRLAGSAGPGALLRAVGSAR